MLRIRLLFKKFTKFAGKITREFFGLRIAKFSGYCFYMMNTNIYPITPFLSPSWIYAHGLKSELKPTGLKYGPIFSIREYTKTLQVQLFFSIKY